MTTVETLNVTSYEFEVSTDVIGINSTDHDTFNGALGTTPSHEYDYNMEYDEYMYPGYPFERPLYLYAWEILVIFVSIVNILVIMVLMRKGMRNSTNMILTFIAIADSLTGLITLPSYIIVYSNFEPAMEYGDYHPGGNDTDFHLNQTMHDNDYPALGPLSASANSNMYGDPSVGSSMLSSDSNYYSGYSVQEGYMLTKGECNFFMISKFYLSKMFHTISIFLTLFLGFQRYVSVAYPFKAQSFFNMKKTVIVCISIFIMSPILHIYHLQKEKAIEGMCEWRIDSCEKDCAWLWFILWFRHLIPCICLTVFTILFIRQLRKSRLEMNQEQTRRRAEENRRVSIIVVAIVIVFLVPEIPYGFFLLSSVIRKHAEIAFDLEFNRAIHAVYEVTLVLSFHANFYIYTFLNRRFRKGLKRTFLYPIRKAMGKPVRWTLSRSFSSRSGTNKKTMDTDFNSKSATEMRMVRLTTSDNSRSTLDTKVDSKMLQDNSDSK